MHSSKEFESRRVIEGKAENEYGENGEEEFDEQLMTKTTKMSKRTKRTKRTKMTKMSKRTKMIPEKVKSRPTRIFYKYIGGVKKN